MVDDGKHGRVSPEKFAELWNEQIRRDREKRDSEREQGKTEKPKREGRG